MQMVVFKFKENVICEIIRILFKFLFQKKTSLLLLIIKISHYKKIMQKERSSADISMCTCIYAKFDE